MAHYFEREMTVSFVYPGDHEIFTRIRMTHPGDPGRISGPPENCYPPEPPEFEIIEHEIPDAAVAGIDFQMLDDLAIEAAHNADWSEDE